MGKEVLNVAKLCNQFLCRLFSNARTSRNIVGSISHQSQQVDDLQRRLNGILVLDFFDTHDLESLVVVSGAVHEYILADQLSVVFVGSHHISGNAAFPGFRGQCSDDIVGFITRGYGISVHRADCPNADPARRKPSEAGRWIKVSWGSDTRESYRTTLEITAKDRINIIMDVSTVLSSTKTHVSSLNARSTPDGFALLSLDIDVPDSEQLRTVMRRLEQISGVMRVTRPAG